MKKKSNSHLILFIIIALILFFIAIFLQNNGGNIRFAYSAENKSKDGVSVFFESVQQLGYSVEVSNESYFYITSETKTLWDSLSMDQKFFCYQIILFLIAFFAYKGKRFGKPIPLYEEVERTENEYVYSAAALYKHAACWDLAAENYYKSFLRLINKSHDNWLEYWEEEQLPDIFNKRRDSYWKQWKINQ